MHIQWFPGHMTKALREMESSLPLCDCIIYVLDARAPFSCLNPKFNEVIGSKPVLYVINKADLVDGNALKAFLPKLSGGNSACVTVTGTSGASVKSIPPAIKKLCEKKLLKYAVKGLNASARCMVIGVPNSGKSSLINSLCGKYKTVTGNKPGVTRGKQWVRAGENTELLDTPGTLYPKLTDQATARKLAYIGSIRDEVLDGFKLALWFIEDIEKIAPDTVYSRYGVKFDGDPAETVAAIAKARGFLLKGGEPDLERAAAAVLDDFRKGRMGKIILDSPGG